LSCFGTCVDVADDCVRTQVCGRPSGGFPSVLREAEEVPRARGPEPEQGAWDHPQHSGELLGVAVLGRAQIEAGLDDAGLCLELLLQEHPPPLLTSLLLAASAQILLPASALA